jgi:hypothetical protein
MNRAANLQARVQLDLARLASLAARVAAAKRKSSSILQSRPNSMRP